MATRGGGGHWHRPDLKPYEPYKYTRRYHLEDINTYFYSDMAPEFYLHLHSMWIASSKQGVALLTGYFFLVILPVWLTARWLMKKSGPIIKPCVRGGPEYDHMAPQLFRHLKANNCENAPDKFGRLNATFYKNYIRQDNQRQSGISEQMAKHF